LVADPMKIVPLQRFASTSSVSTLAARKELVVLMLYALSVAKKCNVHALKDLLVSQLPNKVVSVSPTDVLMETAKQIISAMVIYVTTNVPSILSVPEVRNAWLAFVLRSVGLTKIVCKAKFVLTALANLVVTRKKIVDLESCVFLVNVNATKASC